MGDDLGDLTRLNPVLKRQVEIERELSRLVAGDHGRERNNAAVPQRKLRPLPKRGNWSLQIFFEGRGHERHAAFRRARLHFAVVIIRSSACAENKGSDAIRESTSAAGTGLLSELFHRHFADPCYGARFN